jgi:hypothetical protein
VDEDFRQELLVKRKEARAMTKKVNETIFKAVKAMTAGGFSIDNIAEIAQIAPATVSRIRKAVDLEDYYADMAQTARKNHAKKMAMCADNMPHELAAPQVVEHRQTVTLQPTWAMTQEMQKTNELLKLISNKLAFIVDELCGTTGTKEG